MKLRVGKFSREPLWYPASSRKSSDITPVLMSWLFDTASLTRRLQQACNGDFKVRLLSQRWQRPMRNERETLGMRDDEVAIIRQVHLLCAGTPWVFARTVIPARTLTGAQRRLAHLGNRPLGAMLFTDNKVRRGEMEISRIVPGQEVYDLAMGMGRKHSAGIWGRRSVFRFGAKPLLVSEIFLPDLATGS